MYNEGMAEKKIYTLACKSCGLRYPFMEGQQFGTRCPACMGDTRILLSRELSTEPMHDLPDTFHDAKTRPASNSLAVLLDNIRSAWNVGAILRSADGFGFSHAYLCGITPTPEGPAREAIIKTSLGAEDSVPWSYHKDSVKLVKGLKKEGWKILALEDDGRSFPISGFGELQSRDPMVLTVGNEVAGVDPELLDLCDRIFHIPMHGEKKSFNVAIAFGIAAYAGTSH
jgi:tRNA G18 (ribose-2'-O)-methylase SpoU